MADLKAFAEKLVNLTVKEVNELATILKEEYGLSLIHILSMDELVKLFDLSHCSKSGAKFDYKKGIWFNHEYIMMKDVYKRQVSARPVFLRL